jgi:Protein of unknown function (DUF3866)
MSPISLRRGRVTGILERAPGLVRLHVDGLPCIAYPRLTGPVALEDDVVINAQATALGLGSGGFDLLAVNLTRGLRRPPEPGAHVMKLPYTPLQTAVVHAEEGRTLARSLEGMPVVCCSLHSQVVPVCAALGADVRMAYVQVAGGALPVSLSDAVRTLRRAGLIDVTVAAGACVDGDVACVSTASALAWAHSEGYEAVVCSVGPGIVGTGGSLGHGALAVAEALNVAGKLGGRPVVAPRVSTADSRVRHRHVSHHTLEALSLAVVAHAIAWPRGLEVPEELREVELVDVDGWREECASLPLETMGRGPDDDPWFFAAAYAAGRLARAWIA